MSRWWVWIGLAAAMVLFAFVLDGEPTQQALRERIAGLYWAGVALIAHWVANAHVEQKRATRAPATLHAIEGGRRDEA